jgi:hypothetical protein
LSGKQKLNAIFHGTSKSLEAYFALFKKYDGTMIDCKFIREELLNIFSTNKWASNGLHNATDDG